MPFTWPQRSRRAMSSGKLWPVTRAEWQRRAKPMESSSPARPVPRRSGFLDESSKSVHDTPPNTSLFGPLDRRLPSRAKGGVPGSSRPLSSLSEWTTEETS
jgi:hypothetical protein